MRRSTSLAVFTTLALAALGEVLAAQSPVVTPDSREQRAVLRARAVYALASRETPTLRAVQRRVLGMSMEGAELKAYYRGSELRRIDVTWGGETQYSDEQYYFDGGKPVFVYRKEHHRRGPYGPVIRTAEARFYYDDGALVRWLDGGGLSKGAGGSEWKEQERDMSNTLAAMLCALAGTATEYEVDEDSPPQPGRVCPVIRHEQ